MRYTTEPLTDLELRNLELLLRKLVRDSELMAGLSILERRELQQAWAIVLSLMRNVARSMTIKP